MFQIVCFLLSFIFFQKSNDSRRSVFYYLTNSRFTINLCETETTLNLKKCRNLWVSTSMKIDSLESRLSRIGNGVCRTRKERGLWKANGILQMEREAENCQQCNFSERDLIDWFYWVTTTQFLMVVLWRCTEMIASKIHIQTAFIFPGSLRRVFF